VRVVVDGFALRGTSVSIVTEELLSAWAATFPGDDLHIAMTPQSGVHLPDPVTTHLRRPRLPGTLDRIRLQTMALPRICRQVRADVLLAPLPATTVSPLPCPRVLIHHDLQHEFRPQNFTRSFRFVRGSAYSASFRQADAVSCISARSRDDLLRSRPFLAGRDVRVVHHGTDHVERLRATRTPGDYAIAFGQYRNKNVDLLLQAWQRLVQAGHGIPLHIVGLAEDAERKLVDKPLRRTVLEQARSLGIADFVVALPWLSAHEYDTEFANSRMVVFLSDYEGFGLPAVEAMRLEIPVVIAPEAAVVEVTAGHAVQTAGWQPADVAAAVERALRLDAGRLAAARSYAQTLTWARAATQLRELLAATVARAQSSRRA
jgi:glycosyltransferase involved in cell wall biosynthesis